MPRDLEGLPKLAEWLTFRGYRSSAPKEDNDNFMAAGSENVMLTGTGKTQAFKGMLMRLAELGGIVMMNVAEKYASLGSKPNTVPPVLPTDLPLSDGEGYGNVFNVYASLFYIGKGLLRLEGVSLIAIASSTLWLLVKTATGYTIPASGPWQAGLLPSSAPIIRTIDPTLLPGAFSGKNTGVVSVVIWRIRSTTGAVSNRSAPSNVASPNHESIIVTFPLPDTNGQDYWGIGVTRNGEGTFGSYFFLMEVPESQIADPVHGVVDGTPRSIAIEWTDGDLVGSDFAPEHDFAPPEGFYGGSIEDIVFVDGAYSEGGTTGVSDIKGGAIAPSEPGKPESFSPDSVIFTNDFPTGLIRGDGLYWRFGRNSCYLITYLGGEKPLSVQPAWTGLGIDYQHNAVLGEGGRLHIWPNARGPMRMDQAGQLDGTFATDIADDVALCTDPLLRVLGWDGKLQVVAFCYGQKIWPWFTTLQAWGAPADVSGMITGNITSCVTEQGILLITDAADNIYQYNFGNGSIMKVRTKWAQSNGGMDNVAMVQAAVRADNVGDVTIDIFADGDDTEIASSFSVTPGRKGYQRLAAVWPNLQDCESHAIQITITSTDPDGDCGVESITSYGDAHSMVR